MKVGDYVRTPYGIREVKDIRIKDNYLDDGFYVEDRFIVCGHKAMQKVKSSPNIIDLIEVGDYVNGLPVESVCGTRWDENDLRVWLAVATKYKKEYGVENSEGSYEFETLYRCIKPENIKSIVTKEQFENMEYRIGG